MTDNKRLETHTERWSCYTTTPDRTLETFERARAQCPVAHSREHDSFYMLLDFKDVRAATADHQTYSSEPGVLRPLLPRKPVPALEMDPPRHALWRALFTQALTPAAVAALEPVVRADINRHIDSFIENGRCDFVRDLAAPVPAEAIFHIVGLDPELVAPVREAAVALAAAQGDPALFAERFAAFAALTLPEIHKRRAAPRDDYFTRLAHAQIDGRALDDEDYAVLLGAFLGAGHHSTTSAMSSLIYEVYSRPDIRQTLLNDASKVIVAVEETLRMHPPFFGFFRRTTAPVSVADVSVPENADVYVGWAAANRDPKIFDEPEVFRLDRPKNFHISFGAGIHTCPGAQLARMELRVLLEQLLARLPDAELETPLPEYKFGGGDYAYLPSLPARFTPRAAS